MVVSLRGIVIRFEESLGRSAACFATNTRGVRPERRWQEGRLAGGLGESDVILQANLRPRAGQADLIPAGPSNALRRAGVEHNHERCAVLPASVMG